MTETDEMPDESPFDMRAADNRMGDRILHLEQSAESIRVHVNAIKWLFGICVGLLITIFLGGFGWAWTMQASVSSIQRDIAVQAKASENAEQSRRELNDAVKALDRAVRELERSTPNR